MSRNFVAGNVPLSRFGVLVSQLESIVSSAAQQVPDPHLCFDLLSDLVSAIDEEPRESILLWQRKSENALCSLILLGVRRPVRRLASVAMTNIMLRGDDISIFSMASRLQGYLSEGKRSEPQGIAGAAQCLGQLYRHCGRRIASGLLETTIIASKLMKFHEDYVRQEALRMLQKALEGCGSSSPPSSVGSEVFRLLTRSALSDRSFLVRTAAALCLKALCSIGAPGLAVGGIESLVSCCIKAIDDPSSSVRDAFADALGSLLALGAAAASSDLQPEFKRKGSMKGLLLKMGKETPASMALSWVSFLQIAREKFLCSDHELQGYAQEIMEMLKADDAPVGSHSVACVCYMLRVGVTDLMAEPAQRSFCVFLAKQLELPNAPPAVMVVALRTLQHTLITLGEVPSELKEVLDDTIVAAVSHVLPIVRLQSAATLRVLVQVDPSSIGALISYCMTALCASRESIFHEKGENLRVELDSLHGQASVLAALVSISPKLPLGYPARLPVTVLELSKQLLGNQRNSSLAASVQNEAGWLLLSSLFCSMPKQELEDHVFDLLSLWAVLFSRLPEHDDIRVQSAAVDALAAFVRCFVSPSGSNGGILLQPVLVYLSNALSSLLLLQVVPLRDIKEDVSIFIVRVLMAYRCLPDPLSCRSDHPKIIQLCVIPFTDASRCEESSSLRSLLDKRDSWLGPWLEDEIQHGFDDPSPWESDESSSLPLRETTSQMVVNQMLLSFGLMLASQDIHGILSLVQVVDQCLKNGRKQAWHASSVTNICVGLLAALKTLAATARTLEQEVLIPIQAIFRTVLADGSTCPSHRRAAAEGLGLLARLGNDVFADRTAKLLLEDLNNGAGDAKYAASVAFALGCIYRSAGVISLSSLVQATVNSISLLAKTNSTAMRVWFLHGLTLIVEASGFSFLPHVHAALALAADVLLSDESGSVDLMQELGRLINAIIAVLGPELMPGSIIFSRCMDIMAEISSVQETATQLERVRFTQQLVLFAPQALPMASHVKTLISTLSSRRAPLRLHAMCTLRHIIEKDVASVLAEEIEGVLFRVLDEETDSEIGNMIRDAVLRLLVASSPSSPARWILISRDMILPAKQHLRYQTRVFAAECLSHLPIAVGKDPAHFELSLARQTHAPGQAAGDWLVLHLEQLISLSYQMSTMQLETIRPVGVGLMVAIADRFGNVLDPDLPGHVLLEQHKAQLVSAVRTALNASSGPVLLEAGLHLAAKIFSCRILGGDVAAIKNLWSLMARSLNDMRNIYYPSFAEWVSSKIKIRLLAALASHKCQIMVFRKDDAVLSSLSSNSSPLLKKYLICVLMDYSSICLHHRNSFTSILDGIQSSSVEYTLLPSLEESWPVILQALAMDAAPAAGCSSSEHHPDELGLGEYRFLWGFTLLVLFQTCSTSDISKLMKSSVQDLHEIIFSVVQFLSNDRFLAAEYLPASVFCEFLQVLTRCGAANGAWNNLAAPVMSQFVLNCPHDFLEEHDLVHLYAELNLAYIFSAIHSTATASSLDSNWKVLICPFFETAKDLLSLDIQKQLHSMELALLLISYTCIGEAPNESYFSVIIDFVKHISSVLDDVLHLQPVLEACFTVLGKVTTDCIAAIHHLDKHDKSALLYLKLSFCLEQTVSLSNLAYVMYCADESNCNKLACLSEIKYCVGCFRLLLNNCGLQARVIGIRVLKSMLQRSSKLRDCRFLAFLVGELLSDVLTIVKTALNEPVKKERVAVACDCLQLLALLEVHSRDCEHHVELSKLLLTAIVMVSSASGGDDSCSDEFHDVRTASASLISRVAQDPSLTGLFKDVLLSMPAALRLQFQRTIRASLEEETTMKKTKSATELRIKLPAVVPFELGEARRQRDSLSLPACSEDERPEPEDDDDEQDEDDDHWDSFLSSGCPSSP